MSTKQTNQQHYTALVAAIRSALDDIERAYREPLRGPTIDDGEPIPAETTEDRALACHDELWSALGYILAEYGAIHGAGRDAGDRETLEWINHCVNWQRYEAGLPRLANAVRIPIIGTVVDDPQLGNRVILNGATNGAPHDSNL